MCPQKFEKGSNFLDTPIDVTSIRTIEERLEHATQYARHKMRWHWWIIRLSLPINIAFIIFVFDPMLKGEHWALAAGGVIVAAIALGMTVLPRHLKQFSTPTREQKTAIEDALNARNYPLAMQLVDDMLTYIHSAETLKLAATVYARGGKFHEAEVTSRDAATIFKRYSTSRYTKKEKADHKRTISDTQTLLGIALNYQRRFEEAEEVLLEAMKTDPGNEWPLANYAETLLFQQKSLPLALDTLQKAEALWAKNNRQPKVGHTSLRAWAYALLGDQANAEKYIRETTRLADERNNPAVTSEVYHVLGLAYQALGDEKEARRALNRAIDADPKGFSAQLAARCLENYES